MAGEHVGTGSGYEREPSTYNRDLTEVGRGTPMGELLRTTGIRSASPAMPARHRGRCARLARASSCFATAPGGPGSLPRVAAIAARRSITGGSRSAASAAARCRAGETPRRRRGALNVAFACVIFAVATYMLVRSAGVV
jgi:hypothetical protein